MPLQLISRKRFEQEFETFKDINAKAICIKNNQAVFFKPFYALYAMHINHEPFGIEP